MDFNFYKQYKQYSNVDLLKILKRPTDYQKAAVEAATQILNERTVSEEEIQEVTHYFTDLEVKKQNRRNKIHSYNKKASDFLEPILQPTSEIKPHKWINILLLLIALQYLWTLFLYAKHLFSLVRFLIDCTQSGIESSGEKVTFWSCTTSIFDIILLFEFISLIYIPIVFYLLFKKRRWGWILLFADNLFVLISSLSQAYIFFKLQHIHHGDSFSYLGQIIIRSAFAIFLWRDIISNYFDVTRQIKRKTILFTVIITLIFMLGIQFLV